MKKAIICLFFIPYIIFYFDNGRPSLNTNTYFIYLTPNDKLASKIYDLNTVSVTYSCSCYARHDALEFRCADLSKSYIKRKLPLKTYSMKEFAEIANKIRYNFKNDELRFAEIYIVEQIGNHKYHYYQVRFYPIEGDE